MILVGSEKGGTGKTTLAVNLAIMSRLAGRSVVVLDTDPQQSATLWLMRRNEDATLPRVDYVQAQGEDVDQAAIRLSANYNDVVIDAGGDCAEMRSAMLAAEKMIIPMRPSQIDLWTLQNMAELVVEASKLNKKLRASVVINGAASDLVTDLVSDLISGLATGESEAMEAQAAVKEFPPLKPSKVIIHENAAYRQAAVNGKSVIEIAGDASGAGNEMLAFYGEVYHGRSIKKIIRQAS